MKKGTLKKFNQIKSHNFHSSESDRLNDFFLFFFVLLLGMYTVFFCTNILLHLASEFSRWRNLYSADVRQNTTTATFRSLFQ